MSFLHRPRHSGLWLPRMAPPPNAALELDRAHPLATGLIGLWVPALGNPGCVLDLSAHDVDLGPGPNGPGTFIATAAGIGHYPAHDWWSSYLTTAEPASWHPPSAVSLLWFGVATTDAAGDEALIAITGGGSVAYSSTGAGSFGIRAVGNSTWGVQFDGGANGSQTAPHSAGPHVVMTTAIYGGAWALYVDGVQTNAGPSIGGSQPWASTNIIQLGSGYPLGNSVHQTVLGAMWDRAVSPAEAAQISAAPFGLLRPVARRRYPIPAASGAAGLFHGTFG